MKANLLSFKIILRKKYEEKFYNKIKRNIFRN